MSKRYPYGSNKGPVRTAVDSAANTAVLVFFGALVVQAINKTISNALSESTTNPPQEDLHAVVD